MSATGKHQTLRAIPAIGAGRHSRAVSTISISWTKPSQNNTAAVLLELVQGEGGVYPIDPVFVTAAQKLCKARGALLVVDEVQTGFGRTGHLFASERFNLRPDLLCLAKGIANGAFPMGAVLGG